MSQGPHDKDSSVAVGAPGSGGLKARLDAIATKLNGATADTALEVTKWALPRIADLAADAIEAAEQQEARAERQHYDKCDVCLGEPLPSGKPCMCGGNGTIWATATGLRLALREAESRAERYGLNVGWALAALDELATRCKDRNVAKGIENIANNLRRPHE